MSMDGTVPGAPGVVVVGGGIAGQAVCEAVRELDALTPITLVCAEPRLPYDRVRLSEILVSGASCETLALRPAEWFTDHHVGTLVGRRVVEVRAAERLVVLDDGAELPYTALVLATGSDALMPPIPGIDQPHVHPFRGPEDCDAIRDAATTARHAAVIGGGLLGLEAARGIASQGCAVTVVHLMDRLMERQLDAGSAALLERALGMDVLFERQTAEIAPDRLRFAGGDELEADLVVVSIGIRPQAELGRATGCAVERGIVVDDGLRTTVDGVWAVGECAQHRGIVHGLVAPILDQARTAAAAICGDTTAAYEGSIPSAKLKVSDVPLVAIGATDGDGEVVSQDAGRGVYRKLVVHEGRAAGAILLGDVRGAEALLGLVRRGDEVEDPLAVLAASAEAGPAEWSDDTQVCDCNGVCKGQITAAVTEEGARTPREVMAMTRAGTGCGSCKATVVDLVALAAGGEVADEPAYLCPCKRQTREDLAAVVREQGLESVSEVSAACGTGRDCGACKPALAYLVSEVNANRHREERHARFINDRVHANIQKDGTFSVVPRMYGGVTTPEELRRIADVAEQFDVPLVKVTGGQRLDLLGVKKQDLPAVWEALGMPSGHAYAKAVRTVKTCVGEDFCRFGLGDSMGLGVELEKAWEGLHTPHKVKAGVSGCARNCAEATIKDVGLVAVGEGRWQVRVGGAAGGNVREADVLATVDSRAEALRVATTFLQLYRENADFKERTYDFVPRWGLDRIREEVLGEASGAALRERFRLAKAAVTDPWLERREPYHPRQFTDLDDEPAAAREPAVVGPPEEALR
ncbi:nitrite reductase large subunit NirB [Conexibacter sp. SYSU D00693]|uniref:nitrite reductase large subunit NirB n=1 Tax=Conexibacter sp. SYSU D00693 TaxID=2812560 RepID=UPI00196AA7A9|nr:nitrite reductase large subunit NirB [Conexibacter sp. SYSU D00693]